MRLLSRKRGKRAAPAPLDRRLERVYWQTHAEMQALNAPRPAAPVERTAA